MGTPGCDAKFLARWPCDRVRRDAGGRRDGRYVQERGSDRRNWRVPKVR